ncbi:hypothetical protein IC762_18835 [Bradyrhizobium genosp. L]|nr:hypothetical protein IC762_18835 [Bradyrhizobium genosp. L]
MPSLRIRRAQPLAHLGAGLSQSGSTTVLFAGAASLQGLFDFGQELTKVVSRKYRERGSDLPIKPCGPPVKCSAPSRFELEHHGFRHRTLLTLVRANYRTKSLMNLPFVAPQDHGYAK